MARARARRSPRRVLPLLAATCLLAPARAREAGAAEALNLYEWMGVAPIVVAGRVLTDDQRLLEVEVVRALRGDPGPERVLPVDVRRANREREGSQEPLRMEQGRSYLLLLRLEPPGRRPRRTIFTLVRGVLGVREVPAEGAGLWIEAAERLIEVQDRKDESAAWQAFDRMLGSANPLLLETALDQFLRFRRGGGSLAAPLRPLLDHPRPALRARAAALLEDILSRRPEGEVQDLAGIRSDLIGLARRDPEVSVRVAASKALGAMEGPSADEALREIAREDPDQEVRYAAERLLFERGLRRDRAPN